MSEPTPDLPWLSLVGIGEDGRDGLSLAARMRLAQARLVVGGRRHLELAAPVEAETMAWPSPLAEAIPRLLARRGEQVCVLASGDPFFFGVGTLLATAVPAEEMVCLPAPSSFSLAAARLGWSQQDCRLVSLHGRDLRRIVPDLQPRARILALAWDGTTASQLADLLRMRGCGSSVLHVLERLGGPHERRRRATAEHYDLTEIDALNVIGLEVTADAHARILPIAPGRADEWFEHDGQITRHEVRASVIAALRPFRGAHLWDIGAGSGAVGIEWALLDPSNTTTAVESNPERAARILRNVERFGMPKVTVVRGRAPDALAGMRPPDAVFVGGGATDPALVDAALAALPPGGRLVVNAVTIETQAALVARFRALGGELSTICVAHADPVGRFHGWRTPLPITQWAVSKPSEMPA